MRRPDPATYLPLTPIAFEVLLALAGGASHGYAILQDIAERTSGAVAPNAGTLYRAIARMVDEGLLTELDGETAGGSAARRRYYALTALGRGVLAAEAERLASAVASARARNVLPHPERA